MSSPVTSVEMEGVKSLLLLHGGALEKVPTSPEYELPLTSPPQPNMGHSDSESDGAGTHPMEADHVEMDLGSSPPECVSPQSPRRSAETQRLQQQPLLTAVATAVSMQSQPSRKHKLPKVRVLTVC